MIKKLYHLYQQKFDRFISNFEENILIIIQFFD
jgi:hypothetical protein